METKKIVIFNFLLLSLLANISFAATGETTDKAKLSGNEIDLLVGAPEGIIEPLDLRRTRFEDKTQEDFSSFLDLDQSIESFDEEITWTDAEDQSDLKEKSEATYLDLVSESDDIEAEEIEEMEEGFDSNLSDSVESE
ncbi:MAG: hypothetical protein Kow0029_08960 [Candidatus Rifleibacteriota bacterium]